MQKLKISKWIENLASQTRDEWMETFTELGYDEDKTTADEFKAMVKHCMDEGAESNPVLFDAFIDVATRLAEDVKGFGEIGYLEEFFTKCGVDEYTPIED